MNTAIHFADAVEHGIFNDEPGAQTMRVAFRLANGQTVRLRLPVASVRSMVDGLQTALQRAEAGATASTAQAASDAA